MHRGGFAERGLRLRMITLLAVPGATISAVKIRAVTLGSDLPVPRVVATPFVEAARFLSKAKAVFAKAGIEVQTTRLAGPDLGTALGKLGEAKFVDWAAA